MACGLVDLEETRGWELGMVQTADGQVFLGLL